MASRIWDKKEADDGYQYSFEVCFWTSSFAEAKIFIWFCVVFLARVCDSQTMILECSMAYSSTCSHRRK